MTYCGKKQGYCKVCPGKNVLNGPGQPQNSARPRICKFPHQQV